MTQPALMMAARITRYGGPETVVIEERPLPLPGPGQLRVRVAAAPVTAGDARIRSAKVPRGMALPLRAVIGWTRPRNTPGWSFAGRVDALGPGVTGWSPGQKVFGLTGFKGGAHADYCLLRADGPILALPETLSAEEGAAFFFGGLTAAEFLIDKARVQPGERVLINGATGAVGSAAVQIAAHLGAHVTAVASVANHALARQLGAGAVHDYHDGPVQGRFDVILDVMGTLGVMAHDRLAKGGRLCLITADLATALGAALKPGRGTTRVFAGPTGETPAQMTRLVALHHGGAYRPVLGAVLPFAELRRAHAIAETFHKPGNLVVVM